MAPAQDYTSLALAELNKEIGNKDIVLQRMDGMDQVGVASIPTGSISLDAALCIGGLPRGRIVEIYGPESSGKTTLTLSIIAQAQKVTKEGFCMFIDAEHAMDPEYAQKIGVDLSRTVVLQPSSGEEGLSVVEKALLITRPPEIIVVDSVAALVPKSEIDYDLNSDKANQPGRQAAMMSLALRKLTAIVAKTNTCVIFINQLREKVGMVFGNPETQPGGKALKFYCSVRLDIRRTGSKTVGADKEAVGNHVKVKVVKNKVGIPFKHAEFDIIFGVGIDEASDLVKVAETLGIVTKQGSVYSFPEMGVTWKSGHELEDLWQDEFFQDSLRTTVRTAVFSTQAPPVAEEAAAEATPGEALPEAPEGEDA